LSTKKENFKDISMSDFISLLPKDHRAQMEFRKMRRMFKFYLSQKLAESKLAFPGLKARDIIELKVMAREKEAMRFMVDQGWI
jgi:hypothetical protein